MAAVEVAATVALTPGAGAPRGWWSRGGLNHVVLASERMLGGGWRGGRARATSTEVEKYPTRKIKAYGGAGV